MATTTTKRLAQLLILGALTGCAGDAAHRDGIKLLNEGKIDEGLAKLQQATNEDPSNPKYRTDLLNRKERIVANLVASAESARVEGRAADAAQLFQRVLKLEPGNRRATSGLADLEADKRQAERLKRADERLKKGSIDEAQDLIRSVLQENGQHREAKAMQRKIDEMLHKETLAVPTLRSKFKKPVTLEFRDANLKMVFDALARSSGINFVFDRDVKSDLKTTIFVRGEAVEDAIDLLLVPNQLDKKVLSENTVLIYPNTPQKVKEYQELVIRSFYLGNADPKQTLNMIKTILKTKDVHVDEKLNMLVMRDTPDSIRLAEKLVAAQDVAEPEVVLELEVMEVSRSRILELGVKWPNQIELTALDPTTGSTVLNSAGAPVTIPGTPFTLRDARTLGKIDYTSISGLSATINARKDDTDVNILASPRIRVKNREKAKVHIGDRVPVITVTSQQTTGNPIFTESIQYLDVGLKLEVEPNVYLEDEVSIKVGLEVSSATQLPKTNNGTTPIQVATRNASTVLRLKDGETQVLMGLIRDDERKTANKVPGLGEIPVVGRLFGSHLDDKSKTEIVLSITPRVVRNVQPLEAQNAEYWSGTESALRLKPLGTGNRQGAAATQVAQVTQAPARGSQLALPAPAPAAPAEVTPPPASEAVVAAADPSAAAPVPASPVVLSWQGPAEVKVGSQLRLTLAARTDQPLSSASLQIGFDPSAFKVLEVGEGELMKQGGASASLTERVDPNGRIFVGVQRTGANSGATGDGPLVTVVLEALEEKAETTVELLAVSPVGAGNKVLPRTPPSAHAVKILP